jgi:hypothetical protein
MNLVHELEEFFDSEKNLCLSLASLITRKSEGEPVQVPGISRKATGLVVTDEFKVQASSLLLQRVNAEFLLTKVSSSGPDGTEVVL